ncbi:hypothetical protein J6590_065994 [Homalodisca vitripennis]|nr:hypothetical protein J6590_065994 [Homalodisca vitripennis]
MCNLELHSVESVPVGVTDKGYRTGYVEVVGRYRSTYSGPTDRRPAITVPHVRLLTTRQSDSQSVSGVAQRQANICRRLLKQSRFVNPVDNDEIVALIQCRLSQSHCVTPHLPHCVYVMKVEYGPSVSTDTALIQFPNVMNAIDKFVIIDLSISVLLQLRVQRLSQATSGVVAAWRVTAERSCPCKQPAYPAIGGGSEGTFKSLVPRLIVRDGFLA